MHPDEEDEVEGEEEEEEEEEEEGEEEDEEEEEPKLKYQRLGSNVGEILKNDHASCMTVHEKFLVCFNNKYLLYSLYHIL